MNRTVSIAFLVLALLGTVARADPERRNTVIRKPSPQDTAQTAVRTEPRDPSVVVASSEAQPRPVPNGPRDKKRL